MTLFEFPELKDHEMNRKTLEISISPDAFATLEAFARMRGCNISLAVESLLNLRRAEMGQVEFVEPVGQGKIRETLARSPAVPLSASQCVALTGLSLPTVRAYLSKLEALGHVRSAPIKTRTNFAAAYTLTKAGRWVWIGTIRDPEERTVQEMNAEDLEAREARGA